MIFYPIFYKFDPYFGIFILFFEVEGVKMGLMFTDFLCKIDPLGQHIPVYLTHVKFLHPGHIVVGAPK